MVKNIYFAFHFENDFSRAAQIAKVWEAKFNKKAAGFFPPSLWDEVGKKGEAAIKYMIKKELKNTSVTVFLIGAKTSRRPWVNYELIRSYHQGNGLLAIHIHKLRDQKNKTSRRGSNILRHHVVEKHGKKIRLDSIFPTYDWIEDNGKSNFEDWAEEAARVAGK